MGRRASVLYGKDPEQQEFRNVRKNDCSDTSHTDEKPSLQQKYDAWALDRGFPEESGKYKFPESPDPHPSQENRRFDPEQTARSEK